MTGRLLLGASILVTLLTPAVGGTQQFKLDTAEALTRAERLYWKADTLARSEKTADRQQAIYPFRDAAILYGLLGRKSSLIATYGRLADVHFDAGAKDSAFFHGRRSLALSREIKDREWEAIQLSRLARFFATTGRPDSALVYYRQSLRLRRDLADRQGVSVVLDNIGRVYVDIGHPDSAVKMFEASLAAGKDTVEERSLGIVMSDLAGAYEDLKQYDSAFTYFRGSLATARHGADRPSEAAVLRSIGRVFRTVKKGDSALVYFRAAFAVLTILKDRRGQARGLASIGDTHADLSRPDSALAAYNWSLKISREFGDPAGESQTLNSMGFVFNAIGRPDSALRCFRASLAIRRQSSDTAGEATTLDNVGQVYIVLGRSDSALANFRSSLRLKQLIRERREQGWTLNNIALVYAGVGRFDSAIVYLRQSLAIAREVHDRGDEATILHNISHQLDQIGQVDSALSYARGSLVLREVQDRAGEGSTLTNLGRIFMKLGRLDSARIYLRRAVVIRDAVGDRLGLANAYKELASVYFRTSQTDSALRYYALSSHLYSAVRRSAGEDVNRVSYAETAASLYDEWIGAELDLAERANTHRRVHQVAALAVADRWMAQALLDLMRGTREVGTPTSMSDEGELLLREVLDNRSAVLIYHISPDTVVTWLAKDTTLAVVRTAVARDSLAALAARFRSGLRVDAHTARSIPPLETKPPTMTRGVEDEPADSASAAAALVRLADVLLPENIRRLLPDSGELVIIPHGVLGLVPFAALPLGGDVLGTRLALRYAPSLTALIEAERRAAPDSRESGALRSALIVANPEMPSVFTAAGNVKLPPLTGAAREGQWVATRVGAPLLTGLGASEDAVRAGLREARLVHLATHGVAYSSEARARDSFVAFAPDPVSDGLLTVGEILDDRSLSLVADLVVLSACQTGLGDLKQSEGTVGLQRALLARGARSVLVSLWSVDDESTDALMRAFYDHWLAQDHPSKAEALRRAQIAVQNDSRHPVWKNPRYWAAFQLVGAR